MPSWSRTVFRFDGEINREGPGRLYIKPAAGGAALPIRVTVDGIPFDDIVPAGLAITPIAYMLPIAGNQTVLLEFSSVNAVFLTWKEDVRH